jgi:hypothetical protein
MEIEKIYKPKIWTIVRGKKMFINLAIVPSLYVISTGLSFLSFDVAVIFPVIMIPSPILAEKYIISISTITTINRSKVQS